MGAARIRRLEPLEGEDGKLERLNAAPRTAPFGSSPSEANGHSFGNISGEAMRVGAAGGLVAGAHAGEEAADAGRDRGAPKMARGVWAMMTKQEDYRDPAAAIA